MKKTITNIFFYTVMIATFGCNGSSTFDVSHLLNSYNNGGYTVVGNFNYKKIAVGASKSFSINTSNLAKGAGANVESINGVGGQLGLGLTGSTIRSSYVTLADSTPTNYLTVVAGETQGCGVTSNQRIKCWGTYVGDGSGVEKNLPTFINDGGSKAYVDVASGSYHVCAIDTNGALTCWGDGWDGKLGNGDGTGATQDSPVSAISGTIFKRVAAGVNHTCAIKNDNKLFCWGTNSAGQLGDTTTTSPRLSGVSPDSGTSYSVIAAGQDSTCGITTGGVLKCWGDNSTGQLGNNSTTNSSTPIVIDTGITYSKIAVANTSYYHSCGITTSGVLKCWGDNTFGQLGNGTTTASLTPIVVDSGVSYREVSVTYASTCAITTAGVLKCWGANGDGQLGIGTTSNVATPAAVGIGF